MKTIYAFVALFFAASLLFSQSEKLNDKTLQGKWILKKGWFDKDVIELERLDTNKHNTIGTVFNFSIEGKKRVYNIFEQKFSANIYNPEKLGLCGNGLLYTDRGDWKLNENELTLHIEGGYALDSEFHYVVLYEVLLKTADKIVLKQMRIIKSEKKSQLN